MELTLIYNIWEWKITEIRVTVWLKSLCPREENQIAIAWCVLSPNRPASLTLHCVVYLSVSRENDWTTRTMITLQRSTLARRNSPGFFFFVCFFGEVRQHEMKKEISKSQSWCFYHQRKQIFHKGLQDGCQNTSACVGTWLRSSIWKCLACASCLGSHCSMYFTESPADWFLFCTELLAVKWRCLGIWKLLRCLLLRRGSGIRGRFF